MTSFPFILADSDDIGKIVIGIIVFIIWGISALANLAKKTGKQSQADMERAMREQLEEARRRQAAQQLEEMYTPQTLPPPPPMMPPQRPRGPAVPPMRTLPQGVRPSARPTPPALPKRPQQPKQAQKRKQQQQRRPASVPAIPVPQVAAVTPQDTPGVFTSEIGQGSAPASPSRRAAAAGPALRLTSQSLRQQFILTEILQPPLALRDRPHGE